MARNIYTGQTDSSRGGALYGPGGYSSGTVEGKYGFVTPDLFNPSNAQRDLVLQELLAQLNTPQANIFAAGGADQNARQLQDVQSQRRNSLVARGVQNSGIADASERGVRTAYRDTAIGNEMQAQSAEDQRRLQLLTLLQGLAQADLKNLSALGQAEAGNASASAQETLDNYNQMISAGLGAATVAATLAGGAAGAAGGAAGQAAAGAGGNAAAAGTSSGALYGAIGGNKLITDPGSGSWGGYQAPKGYGPDGQPVGGDARVQDTSKYSVGTPRRDPYGTLNYFTGLGMYGDV